MKKGLLYKKFTQQNLANYKDNSRFQNLRIHKNFSKSASGLFIKNPQNDIIVTR